MNAPTYPAARAVAQRIESRLGDASKPDAAAIEEIINTAFWASLRREEGKGPKISLAFVSPEQSARPLTFEPRLRLDPNLIARLAPAVERPGIHLGVWPYNNELFVWGTTRIVPMGCFVLEVVAPGLLVVKYRRSGPSAKFANVAVLEGADVKFINRTGPMISDTVPALWPLLAFYSSGGREESDHVLVHLAISMRLHGHGGMLLVVPQGDEEWRHSVVQPITYSVVPPFSELEAPLEVDSPRPEGTMPGPARLAPGRLAIEALAGLTAVDGATVISDQYELLAFGVKIVPAGSDRVRSVLLKEPIEGMADSDLDLSQLGGTRHLSAAQFVYDQRNAIALVASQDSRFTVFTWSRQDGSVHARRLEALLL